MPRSLANGKQKVTLLAARPKNIKAPTVTELKAGIDASCRIVAGSFKLGPEASETVSEGSLCDKVTPEVFTNGKASGEFDVFRYFTGGKAELATEAEDKIGDAVYQALKARGSELYVVTRLTAKDATEEYEAGDEVEVYRVLTDYPRHAEGEGFIKSSISLSVSDFETDAVVA